jgi:hypothetical protein
MAKKDKRSGFWNRLVAFLVEAIEMAEDLVGPGEGAEKKKRALRFVEAWYRKSGIRIPYLPGPVERWVIRRIAAGMIDPLVEILNRESPTFPRGVKTLSLAMESRLKPTR